ncbi:MAG: hypothetical protein J4G03_08580 [Gemmatimonadetes bacterium]|nr:hypothetical protein [Gemmatimonadota bacterium]
MSHIADPGSIRTHHFTAARRLRYAVVGTGPAVWFVLHGFNQLAPRFLRRFLALAGDGRRTVVAPEGLHRQYVSGSYGHVGASWMTKEDRETDIGDYVCYLDSLAATLLGEPRAATVLGFSQGAHTALRWAALGKTAFRRIVLWGAGLPDDMDLAGHKRVLAGSEIWLVRGLRDEYWSETAHSAAKDRLEAAGLVGNTLVYDGGHRIDTGALLSLAGSPLPGHQSEGDPAP